MTNRNTFLLRVSLFVVQAEKTWSILPGIQSRNYYQYPLFFAHNSVNDDQSLADWFSKHNWVSYDYPYKAKEYRLEFWRAETVINGCILVLSSHGMSGRSHGITAVDLKKCLGIFYGACLSFASHVSLVCWPHVTMVTYIVTRIFKSELRDYISQRLRRSFKHVIH